MSDQQNVPALFEGAQDEGVLSKEALDVIDVQDIGAAIQENLGMSVDDVMVSEVTLVNMLLDDSSSILHNQNDEKVRDGHNLVIDALANSKQCEGILAMCRCLNDGTLYPYKAVEQVPRLDASNYQAMGGTPLYDQAVITLASVVAKSQEFSDNGIVCRTVTLIVSDGADVHSRKHSAGDVKRVVDAMLRQENHIVAFMGVDDGHTDFHEVARSMGIRDEWILVSGNSASEIRNAFQMFSQSAQRASQDSGSFSQSAMGGFGA